ncbi:hypothetical protein FE697_011940 [Mumia zhuanghuii]|uniref:Universal stress protein family protein n=2 Tax=Mumia TaxID=1546255 RepID=A0ABW1QF67_9ACTN|nr:MULTISPECIES: hypothetical protein [Mumia]KAA1422856.1 hypothetical protein FE697_011940 [Mumia zhuanghuii]
MPGDERPRLPLVHVIAHDGSEAAHLAYERVRALTEETVVIFRASIPPPDEDVAEAVEEPVAALTVDRIFRTARDVGAPYVTIPSSLFSAERILLSSIDAVARLANDAWPAVAVQALRGTPRYSVGRVLVVATHGQSSGSLLLVATLAALLNGATLTKLVVGGRDDERVRPGVRGADAELAAAIRQEYQLPTDYVRLPERVSSLELERAVAAVRADLVVAGVGRLGPGLTHRDFTREGRRRLLAGPLRVEHSLLRSGDADAVLVLDVARFRRRQASQGAASEGLGEYFLGNRDRFDEVVRYERQARNHAAELGNS